MASTARESPSESSAGAAAQSEASLGSPLGTTSGPAYPAAGHATGHPSLEIDSSDNDSAYHASTSRSSLLSIASEVYRGVYENGRRYASFGNAEYGFPNDEQELERLDMQHAMMTLLVNSKLFLSPIDPDPQKVLDLGTGTGIWAIDFADLYPSAEVIGTDLSPVQPQWVPPNCRFELDDAESDWTWEPDVFDYIHNRNFICSIRNWPRLMEQAYRHVKPGGWVEWHQKYPWFVSDDGSLPPGSPIEMWGRYFFEAAENFGTPVSSATHLKRWMEEAGFVDVHEQIFKLPVGPWAKDKRLKQVGLFELVNMLEGIEGLSLKAYTRGLGWSHEAVQLFLMDVRKQVRDRSVHSYYSFYVVYGRKPKR